jgi:hypothetical protein
MSRLTEKLETSQRSVLHVVSSLDCDETLKKDLPFATLVTGCELRCFVHALSQNCGLRCSCLGAFAKFRKATISFVMPVCLSV